MSGPRTEAGFRWESTRANCLAMLDAFERVHGVDLSVERARIERMRRPSAWTVIRLANRMIRRFYPSAVSS